MERVFEFLFKYRPLVFVRGDLVFAPPWPLWAVLALGALVLILGGIAYRRSHDSLRSRDRAILFGLRASF